MSHDPDDYLLVLVFLAGFGAGVWTMRVRLAQIVANYAAELNAHASRTHWAGVRVRQLNNALAGALARNAAERAPGVCSTEGSSERAND